ncbi:MAG: helix-turn-helix domain-containing protein [Deltaproteobacteria bacterium]|nr:helix-turn-helix domain-containing protein [Deltaproteobacteria bacterium]
MADNNNPPTLLGEALLEALRLAVRQEIEAVMGQNGLVGKKPHDVVKPYLTIKEAADISRLGPSTVRLLIRKRQLKALQVGRRVIIKTTDLEKYLEAHPIEALPE